MDLLTLDQSKASLGWARWSDGQARPTYGSKSLGSEFTPRGEVYVNLHKFFLEQQAFGAPTNIIFESPRNPAHLSYPTKFMNDRLLIGLAELIYYFGSMIGSRVDEIENQSWWLAFNRRPMVKKTERLTVKEVTMARCRELGFKPKNSDEADGIGILDAELEGRFKITPPWRKDEVLFRPLQAVAK
jgi:hypothetical protein